MKKILMVLLALMVMFTGVACGRDGGVDVDADKTQIYVDHYNGGFGDAWLKKVIKRFETEYANYQGANGKVGVQVIVNNHKNQGTQIIDSISGSSQDVYFSDMLYYDLVAKGVALDISDVVTEENSDGKTVQSKFYPEQTDYLKYNGRFYALPHYEIFSNVTYNATVFEENLLYFSARPNINGGFIISPTDTRSAGPNGKTGVIDGVDYSYDDGLPATYDDFYKLLNKMKTSGVIPFTWSGEYGKAYMNGMLTWLQADYEGKEQMYLNYSFGGTEGKMAKHLVESINSDGTVNFAPETLIKVNEGYKIYSSAGRYYALTMLEKILSDPAYYYVGSGVDSHTDAQKRFVLSNYDKKNYQKPIAMFVDGNYWENEAETVNTFATLKNVYNTTREDCVFKLMPAPKVDASKVGVENPVMISRGSSLAFINANMQTRAPERIEICKEFLKFCYTDESLREFTTTTNTTKALDYTLEDADVAKLTPFAQSVYNLKMQSDVVCPKSNSAPMMLNQSTVNEVWATSSVNFVYETIKSGTTAKAYFESFKSEYNSVWWDQLFGSLFN